MIRITAGTQVQTINQRDAKLVPKCCLWFVFSAIIWCKTVFRDSAALIRKRQCADLCRLQQIFEVFGEMKSGNGGGRAKNSPGGVESVLESVNALGIEVV